jgi:6-carboxyhexanoate--CoA ligase
MEEKLYCIKMLARYQKNHLCGAERLGSYDEIDSISQELVGRAVSKGKGKLDSIQVSVDKLEHFNFSCARLPDFIFLRVKNFLEGRNTARNILSQAGVSHNALNAAVNLLKRTYGRGGESIPGAFLLDSFTGEILNPEMREGVWIGRVDLASHVEEKLHARLKSIGLDTRKLQDNLVLSAKMMGLPGFVGEINWSNDPFDTGGSISTPELGCAYFPFIRSTGNEVGGRVIFVRSNGFDLESMTRYLESEVLLIDHIGIIR